MLVSTTPNTPAENTRELDGIVRDSSKYSKKKMQNRIRNGHYNYYAIPEGLDAEPLGRVFGNIQLNKPHKRRIRLTCKIGQEI